MFLFFFFIKQKTAYEMRISDWSSDVCSSDLYCTAPPRQGFQAQAGSGGVFARLAPTKAQARTLDVRLRHTRPVVFDHDLCAGTFHPDPHGNEIGRASCRDRVCPSG